MSGCAALPLGQQAPVFRAQAQSPQDAGNQVTRRARFAHEIIESRQDCLATLRRRWRQAADSDQHPMPEPGFCAHARRKSAHTFQVPQDDNDHFVLRDDSIRRPFGRLDYQESPPLKRRRVRGFAPGAVDDQDGTLLHRSGELQVASLRFSMVLLGSSGFYQVPGFFGHVPAFFSRRTVENRGELRT
jgi:hypothetical protein